MMWKLKNETKSKTNRQYKTKCSYGRQLCLVGFSLFIPPSQKNRIHFDQNWKQGNYMDVIEIKIKKGKHICLNIFQVKFGFYCWV